MNDQTDKNDGLLAVLLRLTKAVESLRPTMDLPGVAKMLYCSEDTVRRIPVDELPYSRTGKANVYRREDVLDYLANNQATRNGWRAYSKVQKTCRTVSDSQIPGVVDSNQVDVRKPSRRRVS